MIQFYLDEMESLAVARLLRRVDINIVSSHEIGRDGITDDEVLRVAARERRCVVTRNYGHFVNETNDARQRGDPHFGVALIPESLRNDNFAGLADAILRLSELYPDGLPPSTVVWLTPSRW